MGLLQHFFPQGSPNPTTTHEGDIKENFWGARFRSPWFWFNVVCLGLPFGLKLVGGFLGGAVLSIRQWWEDRAIKNELLQLYKDYHPSESNSEEESLLRLNKNPSFTVENLTSFSLNENLYDNDRKKKLYEYGQLALNALSGEGEQDHSHVKPFILYLTNFKEFDYLDFSAFNFTSSEAKKVKFKAFITELLTYNLHVTRIRFSPEDWRYIDADIKNLLSQNRCVKMATSIVVTGLVHYICMPEKRKSIASYLLKTLPPMLVRRETLAQRFFCVLWGKKKSYEETLKEVNTEYSYSLKSATHSSLNPSSSQDTLTSDSSSDESMTTPSIKRRFFVDEFRYLIQMKEAIQGEFNAILRNVNSIFSSSQKVEEPIPEEVFPEDNLSDIVVLKKGASQKEKSSAYLKEAERIKKIWDNFKKTYQEQNGVAFKEPTTPVTLEGLDENHEKTFLQIFVCGLMDHSNGLNAQDDLNYKLSLYHSDKRSGRGINEPTNKELFDEAFSILILIRDQYQCWYKLYQDSWAEHREGLRQAKEDLAQSQLALEDQEKDIAERRLALEERKQENAKRKLALAELKRAGEQSSSPGVLKTTSHIANTKQESMMQRMPISDAFSQECANDREMHGGSYSFMFSCLGDENADNESEALSSLRRSSSSFDSTEGKEERCSSASRTNAKPSSLCCHASLYPSEKYNNTPSQEKPSTYELFSRAST